MEPRAKLSAAQFPAGKCAPASAFSGSDHRPSCPLPSRE